MRPLLASAVVADLVLGTSACGSSADRPAGDRDEAVEVSLEQRPGDQGVVATVGGVPIYGDCVAAQAETRGLDRRAALDACIDAEVLVAEARRRGLAADPEVAEAGEREMVRALVERDFYANFDGPEDVPIKHMQEIWEKGLSRHFNRAEHRSVFYCRAENPDPKSKKTPRGGDADRRAKKVADAIWARVESLGASSRLDPEKLTAICNQVGAAVGGARVSTGTFRAFPKVGRAVPEFAIPSFAIPEVGMVSPPARTDWGYDLILLTEIIPPRSKSFEEAVPEIGQMMFSDPGYEGYRKFRFESWLADLMRGHAIERFDENIPAGDPLALGGGR